MTLRDDLLGELEHLGGRLGVERRGVLVQEQQLRVREGGHEQRERLALTAGKQANLAAHAGLQAQAQRGEQLGVLLLLLGGDAPGEAAALAAALGERQVFLDPHVGRGSAHRVLEHTAQILGARGLGEATHVHATQLDHAGIQRVHARDHVQQRGLAGAVAADHGHEVAVRELQVHARERALLVDRSLVERLGDVRELKHGPHRPSSSWHAGGTSPTPRAHRARAPR